MTSFPNTMGKQWGNADLRETKQIKDHSKGIDESYPKMYFLLNLSLYVKSYRHFVKFWHVFTMPVHRIWSCHVTQEENFEKFSFFTNSPFNIRKSYKTSSRKSSLRQKLSARNLTGGVENTPRTFRVNRCQNLLKTNKQNET